MAAQSRRTRRNSSTLSRKHQVVEQEVSSDELNIGVLYNVTERIIIPRPVHSKHSKTKLPDEFEIISYIGECSQPFPKFVRFKVPIGGGKTEERLVDKADIVHLSKFDFPGLPDEVIKRIHGFTKPASVNKNGYVPIPKEGLRLSPGDQVIFKDGGKSAVTHVATVFPGGYYKGREIHVTKPKAKKGGTRKHKRK